MLGALFLLSGYILQGGLADLAQSWPQWRGPLATGVAAHADPPLEWSEEKNVRWKVPVPGKGHSTPVVWMDSIFLTTAIPTGELLDPRPDTAPGAHDNAPVTQRQEFVALAFDRRDGKLLWHRKLNEELPHEAAHVTGSFASASPITDGEHVFAFFGSRGLYALDLNGKLVWEKDLGEMQVKHAHGEGSTPVLHEDTLVVNWDHEGPSFVIALDKRTGKELWRAARDEVTSWASPIVVEVEGKAQLIVSGTKFVRGYELETGRMIWECGGLAHNIVASPVAADGMVFAPSSYEKQAMIAIRLAGAKGDLTTSNHVAWVRRRRTPYVPSPLLYGDAIYVLHHYQGVLSRIDAATGEEPRDPLRLPGIRDVYASPVGAAGRVYVTAIDGTTVVLSHQDEPKVLAVNRLNDQFNASAALVGRQLILRGERFLYCLEEK